MSEEQPGGAERGIAFRCPECGAGLRAGAKRCNFCGAKLAPGPAAPAPGAAAPRVAAFGIAAVVALGLLLGALALARQLRSGRAAAPAPPALAPEGQRRASAACEERIRREVRSPFRVIAFPTARVAEERGGHVVSGTVDLQSLSGELRRSRYWCRVRADGPVSLIVEEARLD